ncbi:helix-turn-helix domain-containing protein [Dokdonella sp. MW10]|uniref:helix-turn-helix domain-containing protein n=1 Tax=Dokdonella sp. MW10 TaxID=2992926 RepID=UPI003F7F64EC
MSETGIDNLDPKPRAEDAVAAAPADVDATVGQRLRAGREHRGWSREEVANRLKLQVSVIRRIEEDDYSGIAHSVYLRGYLTSYSRLLGLPVTLADEIVATRGEQAPLVSTGTVSRSRYLLDRYSVSATYLILTGLVVGPAVWLATHGGLEQNFARTELLDVAPPQTTLAREQARSELTIEPVAVDGAAPAVPPPATPVEDAPIIASMAPFSSLSQAPAAAPVPATTPAVTGTHTLILRLKQASWVEILSASGEKLEYGLLPAGAERSYASDGAISVRLGNAEGAEVVADGEAIDLAPFRRANVAHLKVFGDGARASRVE